MLITIKNLWINKRRKQITDPRNIGLYVFTVIVLAISWSTVKTIQANYQLQKKIAVLEQQNKVLQLLNENQALKNKYLETDEYLNLAARQSLGQEAHLTGHEAHSIRLIVPAGRCLSATQTRRSGRCRRSRSPSPS